MILQFSKPLTLRTAKETEQIKYIGTTHIKCLMTYILLKVRLGKLMLRINSVMLSFQFVIFLLKLIDSFSISIKIKLTYTVKITYFY